MQDPRAPETLRWLATLPLDERLAMLHAMSFAFPLLKSDQTWMGRIDDVLAELQPTADEHAKIISEAKKISAWLKAGKGE